MVRYLFFTSFFFLLLSCNSQKGVVEKQKEEIKKQKTLIDFVDSDQLMKVVDIAKEKGKPVFLYLHTEWCTPCKFMEEEVFSHPTTADFMNENFINYEIDMEKLNGPDISIIFNAKIVPTLLFLDGRGRELSRSTGSLGNEKLISMSKDVLENYAGG